LHKNWANTSKSDFYEDEIVVLLFVVIIYSVSKLNGNSEKIWAKMQKDTFL